MPLRRMRPWLVAICLGLGGTQFAFYLARKSAWDELEKYEWVSLVISLTCLAAGLGSLSGALSASRPTVVPLPVSDNSRVATANALRLRQRIQQLPPFGLIASTTILFVVVPMWLLQFGDLPSKGLSVDLVRSDSSAQKETWPEPLILRIDAQNRWYLNGKHTSPSALPNELKNELSRRAQWLVYFEASPEVSYNSAIGAMEIIRAAHARVVLLTPESVKMKNAMRD